MNDGMKIYIAALPPRGWRKVMWKIINAWRWWRFKHSRKWVTVGMITKDDS